MSKTYPVPEFKEAVKSLNGVLKKLKKATIKTDKVKRNEVYEAFVKTIHQFIQDNKVEKLSDNVIAFYNEHVAEDEGDDKKEKKDAGKTTNKKADKKTTSDKKETKKSAPPKKVGVLDAIHTAIVEKGPISKKDILAELVKKFPEREEKAMKNTINCQIGGKKTPRRLEKSRKTSYVVDENNAFSIKKSK